ncbi:MAG: biotin/lipoyl-binding protein [Opitutales bacterium]|nr:biotin/lipoyl-binding protein [Opitutales bacterium]
MKKYPLMIAALASIAVCACAKKENGAVSIPPTPAVLVKAQARQVDEYISTLGTASSKSSVAVVPQVSGKIVSVGFKQGDKVRKGQILATIDKRPYAAEVKRAEGALIQSRAQLKIDELQVERNRKLAKDNYVDKQTFDALLAKVEVDKGLVESGEAALETAKINL